MVVPLLLLLTFSVMDFGRMYFVRMNLQQAVDEAGRFASTGNHLPNPNTPGQNLSRVSSIIAEIQQKAQGAEAMGVTVANPQITSVYGAPAARAARKTR